MNREIKKKDGFWESYTKPSEEVLKKELSPLAFEVTQKEGTEHPFSGESPGKGEEGIYADVLSGEPLFSSMDQFDSGSGWPSFTRPLEKEALREKEDRKLFQARTEVRSRIADSHLGHVFPDGPPPTGLRYCINAAALRFVPKARLEEEGYGRYRSLFS